MKLKFNVLGNCVPNKHYMVDIKDKLEQIQAMVDEGLYFTINCARQYGKTTTLGLLEKRLESWYHVARISFENLDEEDFAAAGDFCDSFIELVTDALGHSKIDKDKLLRWEESRPGKFTHLSRCITELCRESKIVLIIDEVDKTSNNRVFLKFLSTLRSKYLARNEGRDETFHSVILAGVTDIKNLKIMMMTVGSYLYKEGEGKNNSPWNIAASFKVDMSFAPEKIATMLKQYESDHNTGMDTESIAGEIFTYTRGYPFLVSRICQCIDEELDKEWTSEGVQNAVKIILSEKNTLFDDMFKNLENYNELYDFVYAVLFNEPKIFVIHDPLIEFGIIFGFLRNDDGKVAVSNRIFELVMTNYFISKESRSNPNKRITGVLQYDILKNGKFDMELCLHKFAAHYAELFSEHDTEFLEKHGRLLFLSYLKPLINGQGFYHIESQFTDQRRMDVVVDFGREQFIIEMKVWHGQKYKEDAYRQLIGYMDSKNADAGYLLTFDFRKAANKQRCAEWVDVDGKRIFDVVV